MTSLEAATQIVCALVTADKFDNAKEAADAFKAVFQAVSQEVDKAD